MKTKLTKKEKDYIIPKIQTVLTTGKTWNQPLGHYPVGALIDAILEIDEMKKFGGFETNGWQWDWWQHFKCGEKEYTLGGSGYYGGISFSEVEE